MRRNLLHKVAFIRGKHAPVKPIAAPSRVLANGTANARAAPVYYLKDDFATYAAEIVGYRYIRGTLASVARLLMSASNLTSGIDS
ncbi:hypothetical protein [Paraburkholderia humisilvae]|uniref:Uncharacterized protein n=1 Tax=Paraburkholderia humisilvae TaxID=627669 RepID=A0A6J5F397_9BURK|nr:hypothetical protein [Paraburkholderia humisilvae]CAB3773310.1 hypothetical protein LMG29542_07185 [Paraburkholderia humisilvae]